MTTLPPLLQLAEGRRARPRKPENSEVRPRDRNAEARAQAAIIEWARLVVPDVIVFHVPNGGYRTSSEGARFRWLGVLAGVPDIVVIGRDGRVWLLEVKAERGRLSDDQRVIQDRCTVLRVPFAVVHSIDEVRKAFQIWGIETREVRHERAPQ